MIKRAVVVVTFAILAGCARPSPRSERAVPPPSMTPAPAPARPRAAPRHCDCGKEPLRSPAANDGVQRWG